MVGTETEIAKWMDEKREREKERERAGVAVHAVPSGSMSGSSATPVQDLLNSNGAGAGTEVRGESTSGPSGTS